MELQCAVDVKVRLNGRVTVKDPLEIGYPLALRRDCGGAGVLLQAVHTAQR